MKPLILYSLDERLSPIFRNSLYQTQPDLEEKFTLKKVSPAKAMDYLIKSGNGGIPVAAFVLDRITRQVFGEEKFMLSAHVKKRIKVQPELRDTRLIGVDIDDKGLRLAQIIGFDTYITPEEPDLHTELKRIEAEEFTPSVDLNASAQAKKRVRQGYLELNSEQIDAVEKMALAVIDALDMEKGQVKPKYALEIQDQRNR